MADVQFDNALSVEVTWDDVRKLRPPLKRRYLAKRAVVAFAFVFLASMGSVFLHKRQSAAGISASRGAISLSAAKESHKEKQSLRQATLCDTLRSWSSATVLRLGRETEVFCERRK